MMLGAEESRAGIVRFGTILHRLLARAYTFELLAANFIIQSYVSDDVFEDFRAWLIAQGRERFEAALADPETIADFLEPDRVMDLGGEAILLAPSRAYAATYEDEEGYDRDLVRTPEPPLEQRWPDTSAGFRAMYPRLYDRFWNKERIRQLHPSVERTVDASPKASGKKASKRNAPKKKTASRTKQRTPKKPR